MEIAVNDIKTKIEEADLVLIGIGEEFEQQSFLNKNENYENVCSKLSDLGMVDLLPYVNMCFMKEKEAETLEALRKLHDLVADKNYFVVSTCMSDMVQRAGFREDRLVEPCGNYIKMQCSNGCADSIVETGTDFLEQIKSCLNGTMEWNALQYPTCKNCGNKMYFNSLYTENYDENGYLEGWNTYMKWLQGTVNRKVCILELGVGLKYPSVIRWPFEKTGYLNKKAGFIRVNERLYQLTPELKEHGFFIPQNAIDVLNLL